MSDCGGDPNCTHPSCVAAREAWAAKQPKSSAVTGVTRIANGPFRGRVYEQREDGSRGRRRKDLE
jgi:hypothetical protein